MKSIGLLRYDPLYYYWGGPGLIICTIVYIEFSLNNIYILVFASFDEAPPTPNLVNTCPTPTHTLQGPPLPLPLLLLSLLLQWND